MTVGSKKRILWVCLYGEAIVCHCERNAQSDIAMSYSVRLKRRMYLEWWGRYNPHGDCRVLTVLAMTFSTTWAVVHLDCGLKYFVISYEIIQGSYIN